MESSLNRTGLNWKRLLVQYSQSKPELPGDVPGAVERLLAHKHPDWSYEREVRYVVWIDQESGQEEAGIKVTVDDAVVGLSVHESLDRLRTLDIDQIKESFDLRIVSMEGATWLREAGPSK